MMRTLVKAIIALGIWVIIVSQYAGNVDTNQETASLIILLWSIGTVFGFSHHIRMILRMLDPSLKLSVISFLTFRNGFMGSFPVIAYLVYAISLGWIQGIVIMVTEIIELKNAL